MVRNSYVNVVGNVPLNATTFTGTNIEESESENVSSIPITSTHPLYLQNIDHLCLISISKKLTGTENYGPWKRSLTIALSAKNKLGIVNDTFSVPDATSPLKAQWDIVNDMIIS